MNFSLYFRHRVLFVAKLFVAGKLPLAETFWVWFFVPTAAIVVIGTLVFLGASSWIESHPEDSIWYQLGTSLITVSLVGQAILLMPWGLYVASRMLKSLTFRSSVYDWFFSGLAILSISVCLFVIAWYLIMAGMVTDHAVNGRAFL